MQKETIIHNNRKVTKTTKNNGTISYTQRGVYIGIDVKTGKKVTSSITAKTLRSLDRKITQAKLDFDSDGKDRIVKLSDGSEVKMLDKKDYKRISTEFADSLDEKETKRIQSYVDAPGYSGELNDYDPYDENKRSGTRYLYNTTDEKLFIPKNELNKYYNDMRDKFNKEVGTKLNSNWPTDEEREWAKNVLGTNDDHKVRQLLEGIDRATPKTYDEAYENQYYTSFFLYT